MLEKHVNQVMNRRVVQLNPEASIRDAIAAMAERGVTSVVMCQNHVPVGILTARDLPRLYDQHVDHNLPIASVMAQPVETCRGDISLLDALDIMLAKGIRHIPVVDEQAQMQGVVSESNIMDNLGSTDLMRSQQVVEIMKSDVVCAHPSTPFHEIMEIFFQKKVGSLVITDGSHGVGILTERDFPRLIAGCVSSETAVEVLMSKPLISTSVHALAQDALLAMHQADIHHLPVLDHSGAITGIVTRSCFFHDLGRYLIRKLVMAERAIQALSTFQQEYLPTIENFYLSATENAPHGIMVYKMGRIIYCNQASLKMMGCTSKREALGRPIQSLFDMDKHEKVIQALLDGTTHLKDTLLSLKPDGQKSLMVELSSVLIEYEGEAATLLTIKDVTEQKLLEEQFRQSQKMEAVGTLAGGIAHDFNNMLAGITGNSYLLKNRVKDDPVALKKIHHIENLCFKSAEIVSQLLSFSRKSDVRMQSLSLASFVKETIKLVRVAIPENICLESVISPLSLMVQANASQLSQVLINLLNNARDAVLMVDHPRISIQLRLLEMNDVSMAHPLRQRMAQQYFAELVVQDNGVGIDAAHLEKVFEPFFTTKGEGEGTGLGLAMVYGAVKAHDGVIDVQSTWGEGTAFHVYLPLKEASSHDAVDSEQLQSMEGHGETILLVDDDQRVLLALQEVLIHLNYRVIVAMDGRDACMLFEGHADEVALVVTDVVMPNMGGIEVVANMRALKPNLPALFVTGYAEAGLLIQNEQLQQDQLLTKPVYAEFLSQKIYEFLHADK